MMHDLDLGQPCERTEDGTCMHAHINDPRGTERTHPRHDQDKGRACMGTHVGLARSCWHHYTQHTEADLARRLSSGRSHWCLRPHPPSPARHPDQCSVLGLNWLKGQAEPSTSCSAQQATGCMARHLIASGPGFGTSPARLRMPPQQIGWLAPC